MVVRSGEVEILGLMYRIRRTKYLAFHYEGDRLVAIVGLKRPCKSYKGKVFSKAGVPEGADNYGLEIGWAFTEPEYRRRGICSNLIDAILGKSKSQNLFATTRANNIPMQRNLEKKGFKKIGNLYLGRTSDYSLQLYVYTPQ